MVFWEKNFIVIGVAAFLSGAVYFGWLTVTSLAQGSLAEPSALMVAGYVILQVVLAALGIWLWDLKSKASAEVEDTPDGMDERDRLINMKTEAGASHVYYILIFAMMLFWFKHGDASMLMHSLIAAFLIGDLYRCALQVQNYNRAY